MSSTYNLRPFAAEVMVEGERFAVVRDRQSYDAMLGAGRLPPWLAPSDGAGGGS
jgi:diaminopimelate decarboxylase